ncbi:MAG: hypothetical protein GMKNLPBB_00456 [Myxococcota bacterium]|nr:hypothetical protein [Myxococcota bacterium]
MNEPRRPPPRMEQQDLNMGIRWTLILAAAATAAPFDAFASAFDEFGAGARASAMGGAITADVQDYTALYYNPAALPRSPNHFGTGFLLSFDNVAIRLMKRDPRFDVPDFGAAQPVGVLPTGKLLRPRRDTEDIEDTFGVMIGATHDFGIENFKLGVLAYIPLNRLSLLDTHYPDEREQFMSNQLQFDLLGGRLQHHSIILGAGYRLMNMISFGLAVNAGLNSVLEGRAYIPDALRQRNQYLTLKNDVTTSWALHAGLLFEVTDWLRFSGVFRDGSSFRIKGQTEVQVFGLEEQNQRTGEPYPVIQPVDYVIQWQPRMVALGGAFNPASDVTITADITWQQWSEFVSHFNEKPDPQFSNTLVPRVGAEWFILDWFAARLGFSYIPSPVPDQTGRTNYVDNPRTHVSLGAGFHVGEARIDLHVAWLQLLPRTVQKDPNAINPVRDELTSTVRDFNSGEPLNDPAAFETNNPGFPGYRSGGMIISSGLGITLPF